MSDETNNNQNTETGETVYRREVDPASAGKRLDQFLAGAIPELSRSRVKALLLAGQLGQSLENNQGNPADLSGATITDPSRRVKSGEIYIMTVPPPADAVPIAQAIALDILFEDAHLIVLNKPAGMVVHPAPGHHDGTLVNALLHHCGDSLSGVGGVRRPGIVHRLDKDTSGVMVAAKTDAAHGGLSTLFATHDIERVYLALVWGLPKSLSGRIEGAIGRHPVNRQKMAVVEKGGKPAVTHYRCQRAFGIHAALMRCQLETGRTHQIRVHLSHIGHSVIGDPLYGRARRKTAGLSEALRAQLSQTSRQALHASVLGFKHPISGENLYFETPLAPDISTLCDQLAESI